jgi:uncharacterized protein (TIGR03118 family)
MKTRRCSSILVTTLFAVTLQALVLAQDQHQLGAGVTGREVAAQQLVINSASSLPAARQGFPYAGFAFTASGGSMPYTWHVTAGFLPGGLTLNSNGRLSGTPIGNGSTTFIVTVRDSSPTRETASRAFTLEINSAVFALRELVANAAGTAATTVDPNLVNPWATTFVQPGGENTVANNGTSTSTEYDVDGNPYIFGIVKLPSSTAGAPFRPTGMVANSTPDFVVGSGTNAGAAQLIYAGASGMIAAWTGALGSGDAVTTYKDTGGAVYTGLSLANNGTDNFLYATDFHGKKIDVFDSAFKKQPTSAANFSFADPTLPARYAPFGIQAINSGSGGSAQLYVAYAQPQGADGAPTVGQGLGLINVFETNGSLVRHLIVGGPLNAPWGLALAPENFGAFGQSLLVGNFGDGKINAFDPVTGRFLGTLRDLKHDALSMPGLRGIAFGNGLPDQPTLFFAAGADNATYGVYGRTDVSYQIGTFWVYFYQHCGPVFCGPAVIYPRFLTHELSIAEMQVLINGSLYRTVTQAPFQVFWIPQVNAKVTINIIDVAGNVGTACRRHGGSLSAACGG